MHLRSHRTKLDNVELAAEPAAGSKSTLHDIDRWARSIRGKI